MCKICSGKKKTRNLSENDSFPVLTLISVACAATLVQDWAQVVNYFSACLGEVCLFLIIKVLVQCRVYCSIRNVTCKELQPLAGHTNSKEFVLLNEIPPSSPADAQPEQPKSQLTAFLGPVFNYPVQQDIVLCIKAL